VIKNNNNNKTPEMFWHFSFSILFWFLVRLFGVICIDSNMYLVVGREDSKENFRWCTSLVHTRFRFSFEHTRKNGRTPFYKEYSAL